jgi:CzcA family heavy metal efflux pump
MIRSIIEWSLQFRLLVLTLAGVVIFFGMTRLRDMPVDIYPEFTPVYVEVQTEALGLSAEEVEQLITVPMEADLLNGVAWLDTIRSESMPGLSSIVMTFEPGTDVMRARQMVQEKLTQAHALPNVSRPPVMLQPLSSMNRVMKVGLTSDELSLIEMSVLARWTVRPRLMGVPGVANVSIFGQRKRQLQVQVDPERLQAEGLTLHQIVQTTGDALWVSPLSFLNASLPGTGGFIDTPNQRLGIRHVLPISSAEQLAKVVVAGETMLLGDVADVVENHQPLIGDALIDDDTGLMLVVEKFPWATTAEVTRGLESAMKALRPGLSGVNIDTEIFRPASFLELTLENLSSAFIIGLVLVGILLVAAFHDWRSAMISVIAIPLSLAAAAVVLYIRGATINSMILTGLAVALAVVVDDAIIDIQNIARRLHERGEKGSDASIGRIVLEASREMRGATIFATLIMALAVLPVFFMESLTGAFLKPLASSYLLALLASTLVALTVTPALSYFLFSKTSGAAATSPLFGALQRGYDGLLSGALKAPGLALLVAGVVAVAGLAALPSLHNGSLLPAFKEHDFLVHWDGAPGTSHPEMTRITRNVGRELRAIPGVQRVSALVGRAVMSDEVSNVNSSELWVSLDPTADYQATMAAVQQVVDGYPGLSRDVMTFPKERFAKVLTGADDDIAVRIYGEQLDVLLSEANRVKKVLAGIDGVVDPEIEDQVTEPIVEIEVDLEAAKRYGVKPGDVRRASAILLAGVEVGMLFEEQKVFDVVVWGTPKTRHSLTSIRELLIDTPNGEHVRLKDVATVRIVPAPTIIRREGVARRVDVGASVRGRDISAVASDITAQLQQMNFPLEYHAEVFGTSVAQEAIRKEVISFAIAGAIGILLLLQACFGSWALASVVSLTLPIALVGGVLAVLASGGAISIGSLAGFLAVLGIAARNGITLVSRYQQLQREGAAFGPKLVRHGTAERVGPVVLTAVATALLLLPLVLLGDMAGADILRPMALVILGGLVTSTLLTLYVVPALYLQFGKDATPEWGKTMEPETSSS